MPPTMLPPVFMTPEAAAPCSLPTEIAAAQYVPSVSRESGSHYQPPTVAPTTPTIHRAAAMAPPSRVAKPRTSTR